jgi:DNA-binding XRE family transcriptional regulator
MERGDGTGLRNAYKVANAFGLTIYDLWDIPQHRTDRLETGSSTCFLRELRIKRKLRLNELARLSGIPTTTLFRIEKGHVPTLQIAVRLAATLGVSAYQIWRL